MLLLGDETAHRAEAGEDQRVDARLGAAREHGVGVAAPDQLGRLADRVRAGGARGDRRVVRAAEAERDRELPARRVDEHARDERRRDAARPALAHHLGLLHDPEEAADRACRRGSRPVPGSCTPSSAASATASRAAASASRTFRSSLRASLCEATVLGSKPFTSAAIRTAWLARVVGADEVDAAPALDRGAPGRRRVVADRRHRAEPRDCHPSHPATLDAGRPGEVAPKAHDAS